MKYLIFTVGYNALALPCDDDLGGVVALLAKAIPVSSTGFGADERFVPTETDLPSLRFVSAERVTIGDQVATLKAQLEEERRNVAMRDQWLAQEREKNKRLRDEPAAAV